MERGIIELHRAEVLTKQAVFCDDNKRAMSHLGDIRMRMLKAVWHGDADWLEVDVTGDAKSLQSSYSYVVDAWQTLSRAEPLVEQNRKNVWWTVWFFDLKMKLVELQVFAAVSERAEVQLPFFGAEQAPGSGSTIADRLLDNANRMVRLDVHRMARIVESYCNCIVGITRWVQNVRSGPEGLDEDFQKGAADLFALGGRLDKMIANVLRAKGRLQQRMRTREERDVEWPSTEICQFTKDYVRRVAQFVEQATRAVENQLFQWRMEEGRNPSGM
ncbi:MAG: hypothetical protein R3C18_06930 [Planctomycetaceae bacterium]